MKRIIGLIIIAFLWNNSFAAYGGRGESRRIEVDHFDQHFNFYYLSVTDTINYLNYKEKERSEITTVNIAFYDIKNDTTFLLFKPDFNHKIQAFIYESSYDTSKQEINFVTVDNFYGCSYIKNNHHIPNRSLSVEIHLVTYSYESNKYYLWSCSKSGRNLKQLAILDHFCDFKMDIYNEQTLLIRNSKTKDVYIEKLKN